MGKQIEFDFAISALDDYDEDGFGQIQTDSPGIDGSEGTQPAEKLLPPGYYARNLDPDRGPNGEVGIGAPVLIVTFGDRRYTIPLGDPRDVSDGKVPALKKGGRMIAGGAGEYRSFFMIDGEDPNGEKNPGSVMISASYGSGGAKKSLALSFNVRDSGEEDVSLLHGNGTRVTLNKSGATIAAANGKSYFQVGDNGNVLAGASKVQGSMTVGDQLAAAEGVNGKALVALLTQFITIVSAITAATPGAPASALLGQLPGLLNKHFKAS